MLLFITYHLILVIYFKGTDTPRDSRIVHLFLRIILIPHNYFKTLHKSWRESYMLHFQMIKTLF